MAVLTRIKNNQIFDATITGTKMVDQTITSNLFAANLTLASNITVLGNFQVSGTPTTINSINTYINDPLVVFNNGYSGSLNGYDIGMVVNRNLASLTPYGSVNAAWVWVENDAAFEAITTTETGTGITSINNSGFANVKAGNVTVHTISTGGLQAVSIGNVTPGTYTFTTGNIQGLQSVAIGNVIPGSGVFTTLQNFQLFTATGLIVSSNSTASTDTTTGAVVLQNNGGMGIAGNINVGGKNSSILALQNTTIGNITAASGKFTTIEGTTTTNATSASTGALIVAGGAGITKDLWVGGNVYTNNIFGVTQNNIQVQDPLLYLANFGNLGLYNYDIGFYSDYSAPDYRHTGLARQYNANVWTFFSNVASEPGINSINWSDVGIAYDTVKVGELIVANTTATTSTTSGAMRVSGGVGIAGNLYVGAIEGTSATAYLYDNTSVSTLNIANNASTTNLQGIVQLPTGNLISAYGTNSTSTTTGAIVIANNGGLGVMGNVFFGNALVVNSSKTAGRDTIFKGKTDDTLIWSRPGASYDSVLIGGSATTANLSSGAKLVINSTDSIILPVGSNSLRPSSLGYTDVTGMFRFNTTIGSIEWYNGASWGTASTNFTLIVENQFNGDGSTTDFTLSTASTTASSIVAINGIVQAGGSSYAYTVVNAGLTLRFTQAPAVGDLIDVRILTTTQQVTGLSSTLGFVQINLDDTTGLTFVSGTFGTATIASIPIGGGWIDSMANVSVASANTATEIDRFSPTVYRSAKYKVQVKQGTNYQISEALVIHNGTTAYVSEYGTISTGGNLGIVAATITGGNVTLQFVGSSTSNTVRISREYLPI